MEGRIGLILEKILTGDQEIRRVISGDECNVEGVVESYYSNSQSLHTCVNFEDEQEVTSLPKYPTFNEALYLKDRKPEVGMEFKDSAQFRAFIRQ